MRLNPIFEIIPQYLEPQFTNLFCEVSEEALTYFFQNDNDKIINGLSFYELPDKLSNSNFSAKDILDQKQVLRKNYNKVIICYSFSEFALIPYNLFADNEKEDMLQTLYGTLKEKVTLVDNIPELNIHNYYSVPFVTHNYIISHFPGMKYNHQVSHLLRKPQPDGTVLSIIFTNKRMLCTLWINSKLNLSSSFLFRSTEDVIYHLHNILKQFSKDAATQLLISGMIETDSPLAKELTKYFCNIIYSNHYTPVSENLQFLPKHYFSHLFSLI